MGAVRLLPIIDDDWGDSGIVLRHGERGDLDPEHPGACLCGVPEYYFCEAWQRGEDTVETLSFSAAPDPEPDVVMCLRCGQVFKRVNVRSKTWRWEHQAALNQINAHAERCSGSWEA